MGRIRKKARKIFDRAKQFGRMCGLVGCIMGTSFPAQEASAEGWANIQAGATLIEPAATMRIEGGGTAFDHLSLYGFTDFSGSKEDPVNLESFYGELRIGMSFGAFLESLRSISIVSELNAGTNMEEIGRFGFSFSDSLLTNVALH